MALHETSTKPSFRYGVRASGLGEIWTHTHDQLKFTQFGWRCTTKESSYNNKTLIGNWNETRFDIHRTLEQKPLPSQFNHYFETTASHDYDKNRNSVELDDPSRIMQLKRRVGKEPVSFPGHQPEFDHDLDRERYQTFMTTSRLSYVPPNVRKAPIDIPVPST